MIILRSFHLRTREQGDILQRFVSLLLHKSTLVPNHVYKRETYIERVDMYVLKTDMFKKQMSSCSFNYFVFLILICISKAVFLLLFGQ